MLASDDSLDEDDCLLTARLCLRTPRPADAEAIAALADNPKVAADVAAMPHPYARADAMEWIARVTAAAGPARAYLVRLGCPSGPVLGGAGFGTDVTTGGVEIGYWIGEPHWGRGYATEAAQALIDCAFSRHHDLDEIGACCRTTNEASRRVLAKCGFQWAGSGMRRSRALGGMVSVDRYRLDRKAWTALKAWSAGSGR